MLFRFFFALRDAGVPVTLPEFLDLLSALEKCGVIGLDEFKAVAQSLLIKDERHIMRFMQVADTVFLGLDAGSLQLGQIETPEEWLRRELERYFDPQELASLRQLSPDELIRRLERLLAEQHERHAGGSRWIGTGGTSPFGAYGTNPAGIRMDGESRLGRALKVTVGGTYAEYDDDAMLSKRNMRLALRGLRRFARQGARVELDVPETVARTARNAGQLELVYVPERRSVLKVLLLLDVGGSMDSYVSLVQQLFAAARLEFRDLETFYFHNCPYETLWRNPRMMWSAGTSLLEITRTYGPDYRVIIVGDASMASYEITDRGGSVRQYNEQPGSFWMNTITAKWPSLVWLNPVREGEWQYTRSIELLRTLVRGQMFPLTLGGLNRAIAALRH